MMKTRLFFLLALCCLHLKLFAQFSFTTSSQNFGTYTDGGVATGDLDNDGDLDLFFTNLTKPNEVWLNDGKGTFVKKEETFVADSSYTVALSDVDKDGDLDAIVAGAHYDKLFVNNGSGVFTFKQRFNYYDTPGLAIGDLNNDGYPDIVFANFFNPRTYKFAPNEIWLNDGAGNFNKTQELKNYASRDAKLADFDKDGDLDIYFVNHYQTEGASSNGNPPDEVWLNDGKGTFSNSGQALGGSVGCKAAIGDIDGDGDLDVVVANKENANDIWLNDGKAVFTKSSVQTGSYAMNVLLSDIDSDGDLDALYVYGGVGNDASPSSKGVVVWLNNNGNFTKSILTLGSLEGRQLVPGDFDGDGDVDYALACNGANSIYLKDKTSLSAASGTINIASAAGSKATLKIVSNTTWTLTSSADWLQLSSSSGVNSQSVVLTASTAFTDSARTAFVSLSSTNAESVTIKVVQNAQTSSCIESENKYIVYPNPCSDKLFVILPDNLGSDAQLKIVDTGGVVVHAQAMEHACNVVNVTSFPKGVYVLNVNAGGNHRSQKIVKK